MKLTWPKSSETYLPVFCAYQLPFVPFPSIFPRPGRVIVSGKIRDAPIRLKTNSNIQKMSCFDITAERDLHRANWSTFCALSTVWVLGTFEIAVAIPKCLLQGLRRGVHVFSIQNIIHWHLNSATSVSIHINLSMSNQTVDALGTCIFHLYQDGKKGMQIL